jgi:HSP20 family protein
MANIDVRKTDKPQQTTTAFDWQLAPSFELEETKDAYVFKGEVPGVKREDIEVQCKENRVSISGKRRTEKEEKREGFYSYESSSGSFTRSFTMAGAIDSSAVKIDLEGGALTIRVPKKAKA